MIAYAPRALGSQKPLLGILYPPHLSAAAGIALIPYHYPSLVAATKAVKVSTCVCTLFIFHVLRTAC
jgi:hypothetical protein